MSGPHPRRAVRLCPTNSGQFPWWVGRKESGEGKRRFDPGGGARVCTLKHTFFPSGEGGIHPESIVSAPNARLPARICARPENRVTPPRLVNGRSQ